MRIGCLQFAPQLGDVDNNLNRADAVLSRANPDHLDLLVLPEMAFSGYNFKGLQDVKPFLEHSGSGISSLWARTMALKYNCVVAVGYPEKVEWSSSSSQRPIGPEYYNSAIVVNGDGETVANYRKSFLYYTDETWAMEGGRFYQGSIPTLGNVSIGICMDLNPYKFEAPWHAFEFAHHILQADSNLVIVSMAWVTQADRRRFSSMPHEPDMETLTYWVTRLEPLIRSDNEDEIIIVFCNRIGHEDDVTYAGTSAVVGIQDGEVKVYGLLGRGEKELLVIDTNNPPYAKMVYRPDSTGEIEGELKSPNYDIPSDNDESMDEADESDNADSEEDSQNSPGDEHVQNSPVSITSLSPRTPLSPEKAEPNISPNRYMPAQIAVPNEPSPVDVDRLAFPVPSAPSPAQPVRPRLTIPESPPTLRFPSLPDPPNSAVSYSSERSVRSDESEVSVQTIRSNPRAPEESTPHPGVRPGGYHSNEPMTAFDDESPVEARWFWPPPNNVVNTAGGWAPGIPIGRQPEPFPWSDITSDARPPSRQAVSGHASNTATQELRNASPQSPESNASSYLTNNCYKTHKTSRSDVTAMFGTVQDRSGRDRRSLRPSDSNSGNASRSRTHERSQSSLGQLDVTDANSQYLNNISQREESVNRMRSESVNSTTSSHRAESKHRGRGRTGTMNSEHEMIHIAMSPNILSDDEPDPFRSISHGNRQRQRSNSYSNINVYLDGSDGRSSTPNSVASVARQPSRAASRGRTQKPKHNLMNSSNELGTSETERASSTDSNKNVRLHSRLRRRPKSRESLNRRDSSAQRTQRKSDEEILNVERTEPIVYPSFQRVPSSCGTRTSESTAVSGQSSPLAQTVSTANTSPQRLSPLEYRDESLFTDESRTNSVYHDYSTSNNSPVSTMSGSVEMSGYAVPATPPTTLTPKRFNAAALFNPETPKAMVFKIDNMDTESVAERQTNGQEKPPTAPQTFDTVRHHEESAKRVTVQA